MAQSGGNITYQRYQLESKRPGFAEAGAIRVRLRIEKVVWPQNASQRNSDSSFFIAVATLLPDEKNSALVRQRMEFVVSVKGSISGCAVGLVVDAAGIWKFGGKEKKWHEWYFEVTSSVPTQPDNEESLYAFFVEVEHIGPKRAKLILQRYGLGVLDHLDVLGAEGFRFLKMGEERVRLAAASYLVRRADFSKFDLLRQVPINGQPGDTLLAMYRDVSSMELAVLADPLAVLDVDNIGFKNADRLWELCGMPADDSCRLIAAAVEALESEARWGNCWTTTAGMLKIAGELLGVDAATWWFEGKFEDREEVQSRILVDETGGMWLRKYWNAEQVVADKLATMQIGKGRLAHVTDAQARQALVDVLRDEGDFVPGLDQEAAILGLLRERVGVLYGSAGTGKTTITRIFLKVLERLGMHFITLMAPTGAAARRATRATGMRAQTIHRTLGVMGAGSARHHEENPLLADVCIIDETSMVDIMLMKSIVLALPPQCHVYFIGDPKQLTAVGPGSVLRDLLESNAVPSYGLTEVRRNAGAIRKLAYSVNLRAAFRVLDSDGRSVYDDVDFVPIDGEDAAERIVAEVVRRYLAIGDPERVKAIVPYRGKTSRHPETNEKGFWDAGTHHQNRAIADAVMGPMRRNELVFEAHEEVFRQGHRILWTKNTNDELFPMVNGQDATLEKLELDDEVLYMSLNTLDDNDVPVTYRVRAKDYTGYFDLGYARTTHKSQGEGYETVIVTITDRSFLSSENAYTAITRAEKKVVVVGSPERLWSTRPEGPKRRSGLQAKLIAAFNPRHALSA